MPSRFQNLLFFFISLILLGVTYADKETLGDDSLSQCSDSVEKSAVSAEALAAAAKVIKNPPQKFSNEVYSSKVKSKRANFVLNVLFLSILNWTSSILLFSDFWLFEETWNYH